MPSLDRLPPETDAPRGAACAPANGEQSGGADADSRGPTADTVTADTVTADTVTADTVTADTVTADTVTADTVTADTVTAADGAVVATTAPRWARIIAAATALTTLAALAWSAASQQAVEKRGPPGPAIGAALPATEGAHSDAPITFHFLPKPPSTGHLLAVDRTPSRSASLPRVEVAAPVARPRAANDAPPPPPPDPRRAAAVAEFVARLTELEKQRADLVKQREDTLGEKIRLERMIEQGTLDLKAAEEKVIEHEVAIAAIEAQMDSLQPASGPNDEFRQISRDALALYPRLTLRRGELIVDLAKHQATVTKTRVRLESSRKRLQTVRPRLEQFGKQGEFLRNEWIRDAFDWHGKRSAAEHEAAAAFFAAAIDADRYHFAARLGRAVSYVQLKRPAEASADLASSDDPVNPFRAQAVALRAYLKVHAGDETRGLKELGQAVTYDRRSSVPLLLRGRAQAHLRRFPQALADFKAAVQLDGTDAEAHRLLALYHAAADYGGARNLREAENAALQAVDLAGADDWQARLALAAAEADAGRFEAAAGHAAAAVRLTFDARSDRCRELETLFAACKPLRLKWTPVGE